jgi:hypothetical protein
MKRTLKNISWNRMYFWSAISLAACSGTAHTVAQADALDVSVIGAATDTAEASVSQTAAVSAMTNAQATDTNAIDPTSNPSVTDPLTIQKNTTLLGQDLTVKQTSAVLPSNQGVSTATSIKYLGASKTLAEASVEAIPDAVTATSTPTPQGDVLAKTDWYINGTRVWNGTLQWVNGSLVYSGGVSPTQIPIPLLIYPVGPLILELDAGVAFQGDLSASITPGPSYPLTDSELDSKLAANLSASGYLEGYAKLLFVRGGVGGSLALINGSTGVTANLHMNGMQPTVSNIGMVTLLAGNIYGFVDAKILFGKWDRILNKSFYNWPGVCYAFGANSCPK